MYLYIQGPDILQPNAQVNDLKQGAEVPKMA